MSNIVQVQVLSRAPLASDGYQLLLPAKQANGRELGEPEKKWGSVILMDRGVPRLPRPPLRNRLPPRPGYAAFADTDGFRLRSRITTSWRRHSGTNCCSHHSAACLRLSGFIRWRQRTSSPNASCAETSSMTAI